MARKKTIYWGIAMGTSGPIGYRVAVFMKAVGWHGKGHCCNPYAHTIYDFIERLNRNNRT